MSTSGLEFRPQSLDHSRRDASAFARLSGETRRAYRLLVAGFVLGVVGVAAVITRYQQSVDVSTVVVSVLCAVGYLLWRVLPPVLAMFRKPEEHGSTEVRVPMPLLPSFLLWTLSVAFLFGILIVSVSALVYWALGLEWAMSASAAWAFWLFVFAFIAFVGGVFAVFVGLAVQHRRELFAEILDAFATFHTRFRSRIVHDG